jgi:hypothetical protein
MLIVSSVDIHKKIDFINNGSLKGTDYKIRTSKSVVYLDNLKTGGQTEVFLHSKIEVYKFLYRFDNFLMMIDNPNIHEVFKTCD